MAKQNWGIYVAARSGSRLDRAERERVIKRFNSVGYYEGTAEAVVELANLCLEKGRFFSLGKMDDGQGYRIVRF